MKIVLIKKKGCSKKRRSHLNHQENKPIAVDIDYKEINDI